MTPQPPASRVHAPRDLIRRSATFLVAAVVVGGVPFVAHAITDDPATEAAFVAPVTPAAAEPAPAPALTTPRPESPIPDLGADLQAATGPVDVAPAPEAVPVVEGSLPSAPVPEPEVAPPGPAESQWAALRDCESGGDYSITNPSGKYRGAYQFDRSTWNSVAERHSPVLVGVDPAAASPADQDAMALALFTERGARPWPHCGRHLN